MDERPVVLLALAHDQARRALADLAPIALDVRLRWDPIGDAVDPATAAVIVTDRPTIAPHGVHVVRTTDPRWLDVIRDTVAVHRQRSETLVARVPRELPHPATRCTSPRPDGVNASCNTDSSHEEADSSHEEDRAQTKRAHEGIGAATKQPREERRARLIVVVDLGTASSVAIAAAACAGPGTLLVDVRDRPTLWFLHDLAPERTTIAEASPERPYELAPPRGTLAQDLVRADPLAFRAALDAATRSYDLMIVATDAPDLSADDERSTALRSLWRNAQATVLAGGCRLEDRFRMLNAAIEVSTLRDDVTIACASARGVSAHTHANAIVRALRERIRRSISAEGFGLQELSDVVHERQRPIPDRQQRTLAPVIHRARGKPPLTLDDPALQLAPVGGLDWLAPDALEAIYHTSSDGREAW